MTLESAQAILDQYERLISIANSFEGEHLRNKGYRRSAEVRFQNGYPEYQVNTACHCHPEYEWKPLYEYGNDMCEKWEEYLKSWED